MHTTRMLLVSVTAIQLCLCAFLTQRELQSFLGATTSWTQALSYHSYYVSSPAYEADLAQKRNAQPIEVVITGGDFIVETIEGWKLTMTRHRNGFMLMGVLTILSMLQALMVYVILRRNA